MNNLFEAARVKEVKERIAQLRPISERVWGKEAAQPLGIAPRPGRWGHHASAGCPRWNLKSRRQRL